MQSFPALMALYLVKVTVFPQAEVRIPLFSPACEHQDNADHNAGRVIARRGVRLLLSGGYSPREVKRCGIFRQKVNGNVGPVRSEFTPVESIVSRVAGNGQTRGTEHPHSKGKKQETLSARKETHATIAHAV